MKLKKFRLKTLPIFVAIAVLVIIGIAWHFSSIETKAKFYRIDFFDDFYATHNHLGHLLKIGMAPEKVHSILGEPDIIRNFTNGIRWDYGEEDPTASGVCVVDFKTNGLCFFLNVQSTVFPTNTLHSEFGSPIDGGKFDGDGGLQLCWRKWHEK